MYLAMFAVGVQVMSVTVATGTGIYQDQSTT